MIGGSFRARGHCKDPERRIPTDGERDKKEERERERSRTVKTCTFSCALLSLLGNSLSSLHVPRFLTAFPQECFYQGESFACGLGMNCWMQGKRPVDLCSGGVLWSCCVPFSVQASPAGVISDPGESLNLPLSNFPSNLFKEEYTRLEVSLKLDFFPLLVCQYDYRS